MADENFAQLSARLASVEEVLKQVSYNTRYVAQVLSKLELPSHIQAAQELFYGQLIQIPRYQEAKRLQRFERKVFSQNGEDGIIQEIFNRIGTASQSFLEVGVEHGRETNTTWLLQKGWRGVWVDADRQNSDQIGKQFASYLKDRRLILRIAFATAENIVPLLDEIQYPGEFDLVALDIDRNTYYLWKALGRLKPRVVVVEYNALYPPEQDWRVEYVPERTWNNTSHFGASLKAYELLGKELGYCLVGCDTVGVNAFFVREDLVGDHFAAPFTSENHYEPPRYYLYRTPGHPRAFDDGPG
jgi:hypothetical protein